ncbi:hypothetical protein EDL96_10940 [Kocuria soli]|uniref:Uncharacterized protein n=1 Tax=Kocuria soli TaxID=2485125 RepID=A0A3N4A1R1_9MICC|nr:hypothetical protein EDL96_10940 [Kocuria soli]
MVVFLSVLRQVGVVQVVNRDDQPDVAGGAGVHEFLDLIRSAVFEAEVEVDDFRRGFEMTELVRFQIRVRLPLAECGFRRSWRGDDSKVFALRQDRADVGVIRRDGCHLEGVAFMARGGAHLASFPEASRARTGPSARR